MAALPCLSGMRRSLRYASAAQRLDQAVVLVQDLLVLVAESELLGDLVAGALGLRDQGLAAARRRSRGGA